MLHLLFIWIEQNVPRFDLGCKGVAIVVWFQTKSSNEIRQWVGCFKIGMTRMQVRHGQPDEEMRRGSLL